MKKYKVTYEDGILDYKKAEISASSLSDLERKFFKLIGLKKIISTKLID